MRTNNLMPTQVFVDWLGLDSWYYWGIKNPNDNPNTQSRCPCYKEHPYQDNKYYTRQQVNGFIEYAERIFVDLARFYPSRIALTEEKQFSKFIEPNFNKDVEFGLGVLNYLGNYTVTKTDQNGIKKEFCIKITLMDKLDTRDIRVYVGGYHPKNYNDRYYEIRPLNINIVDNVLTICGYAFMFKEPELDNNENCLLHEVNTYIDNVEVYLSSIDKNQQGHIISNNNCPDCQQDSYTICVNKQYTGDLIYGKISVTDTNILYNKPHTVNYNYVSGEKSFGFNNKYSETISKLAVSFLENEKDFCYCVGCPTNKVKYYRAVPKTTTAYDAPPNGDNDFEAQVLLTTAMINKSFGFIPSLGFTQALKEIYMYRFKTVEGSSLYGRK